MSSKLGPINATCQNCLHIDKIYCALSNASEPYPRNQKKDVFYPKGSYLFKERSYPINMIAIVSGNVKISKIGDFGKEQIVRFAKGGDLIGYRSLFGEDCYHASAIALNDVVVCKIPKEFFLNLASKNKNLNAQLLKMLAEDLKKAENKILSFSQKTVKERVAEALVILFFKFGQDENLSLKVKLTRKEIGNIAGTTIETTIRTLSTLKKENFIQYEGKDIIIKDINKLIALSNSH